jgi:triphosphatase
MAPTLHGDVEGLHQMRVSLRRLRADLVLFKPFLAPQRTAAANDRLRELGRLLGEARDWDVMAQETLPAIADKTRGEAWPGLLRQLSETRRTAAHDRVVRGLAAPEFTALVLSLAVALEDGEDGFLAEDAAVERSVARAAPALLDRLARKVRKRGKHARRLDGPKLHALRKSMKKLRYGVDALQSLFERREVERYLDHCKSLQKILGGINDAVAAERLMVEAAGAAREDLAVPLDHLADWARRRRRKHHRKLGRAWAKFTDARPFWQ